MRALLHRSSLRDRIVWIFAALAATAVCFAGWSVTEAVSARRLAGEADQLRVATLSLASADALAAAGGAPDLATVAASVEMLDSQRRGALDLLSPADAARADHLLDDIANCGWSLLDPSRDLPHLHDHHVVLDLLETAAETGDARATEATGDAVRSAGAAALAGSITVGLLLTRGARTRRRTIVAETEASLGRRLTEVLDDWPDGFVVAAPDGSIVYRSPSAGEFIAPDVAHIDDLVAVADEAQAEAFRSHLVTGANQRAATFEIQRPDGVWVAAEVRVSDLRGDSVINGNIIVLRDTTAEVELRAELRRQAATDPLTGLPNRRVLTGAIERAAHDDAHTAMLLVDVDGFKAVNDLLGHIAGDELLVHVAGRLRAACPDHMVIRLGGDEFAVVARSVESDHDLEEMATALLDEVAQPFRIEDRAEAIRLSVGAALAAPAEVESLVHRADIAMYVAKREGGGAAVVYQPEFEVEAAAELHMERALAAAEYDDEFHLVFQPIVRSEDAEVIGLEALLRWNSPDLGSVRPDLFIPVAERTGDILEIGRWVVIEACRQIASWNAERLATDLTVSVNVSPRQLNDDDFVPFVLSTLADWGVAPERLAVEVTESVAIQNTALATHRLGELRKAGVSVSIDDFGDGFSNLGQLLQVPFDTIKVDRSLLLMLGAMRSASGGDASKPCEIMGAIVAIASATGAKVVCEGVEEESQRASLARSGVDYVQGYLTGRPQPPDVVESLLRETAGPAAMSVAG